MSNNASTSLGVMGMTFVLLYKKDPHFPASLSQRIPSLSPLLAARIGAIVEHLATSGIISRKCVSWNLGGVYPYVKPSDGDWQGLANSVRLSLKPLRVSATLQESMKAIVKIQNDAMMVGFGKLVDGMNGTLSNAHTFYKDGKKYWTYGKTGFDKTLLAKDVNSKILNYKGDLVNLFINLI